MIGQANIYASEQGIAGKTTWEKGTFAKNYIR